MNKARAVLEKKTHDCYTQSDEGSALRSAMQQIQRSRRPSEEVTVNFMFIGLAFPNGCVHIKWK